MPFNVSAAAAHIRRIVLKFNAERLEIRYNAGSAYREYQLKAQKLDQEFSDLQRRIQSEQASDEDYQELVKAMASARRRLADNICTVIESWDLEGDLDSIKQNMSEKDRKEYKDLTGHGEIPVSGAWLDALPLPDEFILKISEGITNDFDTGGRWLKKGLRAYLTTGGLIGHIPEYVEAIAYTKFLNKEFGYNLTVPEFLAKDSPWDEHHLDWHITYASVFRDPQVLEAMQKHRDKFSRKGIFSAVYEMGGEQEE